VFQFIPCTNLWPPFLWQSHINCPNFFYNLDQDYLLTLLTEEWFQVTQHHLEMSDGAKMLI
jgi:hypothetical protein